MEDLKNYLLAFLVVFLLMGTIAWVISMMMSGNPIGGLLVASALVAFLMWSRTK